MKRLRLASARSPRSTVAQKGSRRLGETLGAMVLVVAMAGCSADDAESIDPESPPASDMTDVTHTLEPTDQMRDAAVQQCLDDPELDVGYVRAVAPESGAVLSELEIDCEEARADG